MTAETIVKEILSLWGEELSSNRDPLATIFGSLARDWGKQRWREVTVIHIYSFCNNKLYILNTVEIIVKNYNTIGNEEHQMQEMKTSCMAGFCGVL